MEISELLEQQAKEDLSVLMDYVPRVISYYQKNKIEENQQELVYIRDSFQRFLYLRFYLSEKDLDDFNDCVAQLVGFLNTMNEKVSKAMMEKPNIEVVRG